MHTAYDKGISQLDNCVGKTTLPLFNSTNHIYLPPKQKTDLRLLDLANRHDVVLLHKIGNGQSHHTQAVMKLQNQELVELLIHLISYPINLPRIPWFDEHRFKQYRNMNLASWLNSVTFSKQPQAANCATFPHLSNENRNTHFSETIQRAMLSGYPGLIDDHLERPLNNVIYLDRFADADTYISGQQLNDFLTQRHIEIELLKRTLLVSRKRLTGTKIKLYKAILKNKKLRKQRRILKTELKKLLENSEALRKETSVSGACLSGEQFDTACSEQPLQKQILMDKPVEQMQIMNLQQSLTELQDQLAQVRNAPNETELGMNDALNQAINRAEKTVEAIYSETEQMRHINDSIEPKLEENRLQSSKTQEDNNTQLAELQVNLNGVNCSGGDDLAEAEAEISALKELIEAKETSRQQLQREKAVLASSLQAETSRSLEFVDQAQSLGERIKSLEIKLKAKKQAGIDAEVQHNNAIAAAKEELDQALKTIEGLKDTHQDLEQRLQQEQAEFKVLQEKMNQALEAEKQHTRDQQTRFEATIEAFNLQLDETKHQAQADSQSLQEKMQQALTTEKQHAEDEQERLNSVIEGLNRQLETDRVKAEQQLEEARQQARAGSQILLGRMNQALATEKQQAREEQTRLEAVIEGLNQQLRTTRTEADRQLDEARQQAQADIQSLQEQMDQAMVQALEAEKQQAREEQNRFEAEVKGLNQQLQANQAKAEQQLDEARRQAQAEYHRQQQQIEQALETEKQNRRHEQTRFEAEIKNLNDQLKTTEKALNESEKRIADAERSHQETLSELQQELESNENAWSKLAEAEVETQTTKQELSSLRNELEQEITNLRAQLEHQQQSSNAVLRRHKEDNEQLQQSLSESQEKLKLADSNIRIMKRDQESQRKIKSQFEDQLEKLRNEAKIKQAELTASIESERQKVVSLRRHIELAKIQKEDSTALQRVKEENMLLKRKIKGMREVQLEMENQLIVDGEDEIRELHEELKATRVKLKNVEKLAEQSKRLSRENLIHVSAIDMLSEDLDVLTEEKESLKKERNGLIKELSEIKEHFSKLAS